MAKMDECTDARLAGVEAASAYLARRRGGVPGWLALAVAGLAALNLWVAATVWRL